MSFPVSSILPGPASHPKLHPPTPRLLGLNPHPRTLSCCRGGPMMSLLVGGSTHTMFCPQPHKPHLLITGPPAPHSPLSLPDSARILLTTSQPFRTSLLAAGKHGDKMAARMSQAGPGCPRVDRDTPGWTRIPHISLGTMSPGWHTDLQSHACPAAPAA